MNRLVKDDIENYARAHSAPVPELMEELREYTQAHIALPQMQVGPLEGNFLKVLARIRGARRILEVGTFTGYSAMMMASGLPEDGRLHTCELSDEVAAVAQSFFDRHPHGHKIKLEIGPAIDTINRLDAPFDMAFIDADKVNYTNYFDLILPKMAPAGLIVIDNVLWSGRILEDQANMDESTAAIAAFNRHIGQLAVHDRVMLTVRDGMTLVVV